MMKINDIKNILNLEDSVESYILQTCQDALCLSGDLRVCENNSPNRPPFAINYLEYYNSYEPVTSWIIRHIFAYSYKGKHPYFDSFAESFLQQIGFNMEWIDSPTIDKDHEYKSIDILVRDKHYAIIIENKLKGAHFQLNQLARYIATMRKEGYSDEQIFVVILPEHDISNANIFDSVWKLPKDWQSPNRKRKCRINDQKCWCDCEDYKQKNHCSKCEPLQELYAERTIFIHKELSEWLYGCIANNSVKLPEDEYNKQYVLKSAALQFVDFLNSIYNTRENDKYIMDTHNFLSEQLKLNDKELVDQLSICDGKLSDIYELADKMRSLYKSKVKDYMSEVGKTYNVHINYTDGDDYYDYYDCNVVVDGKTLMVCISKENEYFCQIDGKGRRIPEIVKEDFDICEELNDPGNNNQQIWRYDESYHETLLRFERILGRLIELQQSK